MIICGCCCKLFAIVIWNSNRARDDNFKVLLNGTDIGHIDNNQNLKTGRIFTDSSHSSTLTPDTIGTPIYDTLNGEDEAFEDTVAFDFALLINGTNTLRIESIQNNNNGNAGSVRVAYWTLNGTTGRYDEQPPLLSDAYSFSSGVGNGQDYTFTYP